MCRWFLEGDEGVKYRTTAAADGKTPWSSVVMTVLPWKHVDPTNALETRVCPHGTDSISRDDAHRAYRLSLTDQQMRPARIRCLVLATLGLTYDVARDSSCPEEMTPAELSNCVACAVPDEAQRLHLIECNNYDAHNYEGPIPCGPAVLGDRILLKTQWAYCWNPYDKRYETF